MKISLYRIEEESLYQIESWAEQAPFDQITSLIRFLKSHVPERDNITAWFDLDTDIQMLNPSNVYGRRIPGCLDDNLPFYKLFSSDFKLTRCKRDYLMYVYKSGKKCIKVGNPRILAEANMYVRFEQLKYDFVGKLHCIGRLYYYCPVDFIDVDINCFVTDYFENSNESTILNFEIEQERNRILKQLLNDGLLAVDFEEKVVLTKDGRLKLMFTDFGSSIDLLDPTVPICVKKKSLLDYAKKQEIKNEIKQILQAI